MSERENAAPAKVKPMKQPVSVAMRQRILDLRRASSLQQVAQQTGVPLGTVKTICSRSGSFRSNPKHRAMFSLPPIIESTVTAIAVPVMPTQQVVTGDKEVDAVLWLQQVVSTGQSGLIDKARQAMARIKTPLPALERRYRDILITQNPGNPMAVMFSTFGFGDLEGKAERAVSRNVSAKEALARFGSETGCFNNTPAEDFIVRALKGIKLKGAHGLPNLSPVVISAFQVQADYLPHTLDDCLHELRYWSELYRMRHAVCKDGGDGLPEEGVRCDFLFHLMATIRPIDRKEALAVMKFMMDDDHMDKTGADDIFLNLLQ